MVKKKTKDYLENRFKLIEKVTKNHKYEPTGKELHEAYGYLDYCCWCGKELKWIDAYSHGFEGNAHKFGCSGTQRFLGWIYTLVSIPIKLLMILISLPFALLIWLGDVMTQKKEKHG